MGGTARGRRSAAVAVCLLAAMAPAAVPPVPASTPLPASTSVPASTPAAAGTPAPAPGAPAPLPGPPGPAGATDCALLLAGEDADGRMVLQTVAYALDRPGMLLAPRRPVERPGAWRRLVVRPDPGGQPAGRPAPLEVTGALADDPERDLLVLHAPGLPACGHDAAGVAGPGTPLEAGQALVGLRDREGYRPRVFPAALERRLRLPGGPDLLLVRIPDGGGAPAGFLLDRRLRLVATILPPPPGADATLACAVPYEGAGGAGDPGGARPPRQAIESHRTPADEGPVGRLARALLLTRDDQALEAIALLDRVALEAGAFPDLWLERGIRRYRIGRTEAAAGDFAAAAVADPGMHLAHFNLGMALGTWGRYREAAEAFSRALRLRPDHAATLYHLALALHASGAVDRARGEVERLSSLDPGLAAALRPLLVP